MSKNRAARILLSGVLLIAALGACSNRKDIYGIDPAHIGEATRMSNAYFAGANAAASLALLARQPDGVLVSEETRQDFQLNPGDHLDLRLQFAADQQYHTVPFRFVGVVREFPTAPKDSFLVANSAYIERQTGSSAREVVLIKASGDPVALAAQVKKVVSTLPGVKVTDIASAQKAVSSSLTSVNLHGLTRLELALAVVMLMGATGLVFALGLNERRRNFAILGALGARGGQLGAFIWSEALVVLLGGAIAGTLLGVGVSQILVTGLKGIFDPPPRASHPPVGLPGDPGRVLGAGDRRGGSGRRTDVPAPRGGRAAETLAEPGLPAAGGGRKMDDERRAFALELAAGRDRDGAAMGGHQLVGDREAKTCSSLCAAPGLVDAVETFEKMGKMLGGDSWSGVRNGDAGPPGLFGVEAGLQSDRSFGRVLGGILQKVGHDLGDRIRISGDHEIVLDLRRERQPLVFRQRAQLPGQFAEHAAQVDRPALQVQPAGISAGQEEQSVHEPVHPIDLLFHIVQHTPVVAQGAGFTQGQVQAPLHHRQRRAQLVGGVCCEAALATE
jgi:hypothetical protein